MVPAKFSRTKISNRTGVIYMPFSLRTLKVDEKARITAITANGEISRRLRDMGLVPGTEVKVIGRAPLKDPVALRLRDFTLTLRNNEADCIIIEKLEDTHE